MRNENNEIQIFHYSPQRHERSLTFRRFRLTESAKMHLWRDRDSIRNLHKINDIFVDVEVKLQSCSKNSEELQDCRTFETRLIIFVSRFSFVNKN